MKFIASDEQLKQIFNAIQASKPWTNSLGVQYSMEPLNITPQHTKLIPLLQKYATIRLKRARMIV
jgi:hypothetical protein